MGKDKKKKDKCCGAYLKKGKHCSGCPLKDKEEGKAKKKDKDKKKDKKKKEKKKDKKDKK